MVHRPAAIRDFIVDGPLRYRWLFRPVGANGQVAFGTYLWEEERRAYVWISLDVLRLDGDRIAEVVSFLRAGPSAYGLPQLIPAVSPRPRRPSP